MSEKDELELDGGFQLSQMVQAQRGLSDREIEIFLATGEKPDLSQPPPEDLEALDGETQVMSEEDAAAWLSGAPLTASAFYDFDSHHGISPLYEVVRPKVLTFDFDKNQPRRYDGRWVKIPGSGLSKKLTDDFKKLTNQDVANMYHEMHGKKKWTAAQAKALNHYASDGHKTMNPALRGQIKPDAKTTKLISDAKAGLRPTSRDIRVYRGTNPSQFGVKSTDELEQHIGEVFHDPAFASTTVNRMNKVMSGSSLRLEIEVPKGTPGAYIADISNNPGEQEFLLGPDLHYELMEVKDTPLGKVARLRVVPKPTATEEHTHEVALDPATDAELPEPIEKVSAPSTASSKPVVPATIYKKHDDGAVIAATPDGQRMRWDAGSKKYAVEKQQNGEWVQQSSLAKGAAYAELKKSGAWFEPGDDGPIDAPSVTPDPTPVDAPSVTAPATPSSTKIKPSAIYAKHDDGATVAQSADGNKRMRWDADRKKFVVENRKDDGWAEESALTKGAAYNDVKNSDKWFESTETGTENRPSETSLTPEPDLADTEPTAPEAPEAPAEPEAPEAPAEPETTPEPEPPTAPEIPKQADAPAVEMDDTPGVYTGPTIENYAGAPKETTDKVRAAYLAAILHDQRVEERADELKKEYPDKYTGYDGWSQREKDARAELAGEAPPDSNLDDALEALQAAIPDYTVRDNIRRRLNLEAAVESKFTKFTEKNGLGALTPEVKADLTKRTKEAFAGKKVAVRVSPKTVEHILNDGRIKSQFETNKSSGKKDVDMRASVERLLFGINDKPWQNAEKRPIYGYVAMDGIRPAGIGSAQLGDPSTDALSQYGNVQVVLKDSVRDRTTALFGDSLNNMQEAIPTPINNPDWRSFQASRGGITGKGLEGLDRSGENQDFRAGAYAEAQIHGGVGVEDIEEIVFPSNPTATVKQQLEKAGIPYRVLTFKTAADGSDEERVNALRIAKQDKPFIEGEIKKLQDKLADPKYLGDSYYTKDLAKYEKQLKAINDALPLLEGTKTSPAKKVAAAKAKVAQAAAPKQAEAPKIESTTGTKLTAAEEQELTSLQSQIADLYGDSGYWRMREAEITHKGNGGYLTPQDLKDSEQARTELKKLRDAATPLAERELELRMKRDGDVFGEVEDANAERWASKTKPSTVMLPGNDPVKIEKIADSYRVNDKATTEHNMSLRTDEPSQAAVSWRSRMRRMINSQQLSQDAVVYRGAALTPERIAQLRPGAVMIDPGSMSTADTQGDAAFYMKTRLDDLPGTLGTMFEIRAPKGMPAADVEYGEYVFDFHTPMRIVSTKRENGIIHVVAELVPPAEAKALYGAPPVPKAAKPSGVNLNAGKKGSINAKEAKRYQEDFAKAGLQPSSSAQEIFDKLKSKAYYNDRSIMQILEAIDAMKPGYKKTVLDWLKTPEGSEYVSQKSTS